MKQSAPRGQSMDGNRGRLTPLPKGENPATSGGNRKAATFNQRMMMDENNFEVRGSHALTMK